MINLLLFLPIFLIIIMLFVKKKVFSNLMLNFYAIAHFLLSSILVFDGKTHTNIIPYFAIDDMNKIFLIVLSLIFLLVTVYNNGYMKNLNSDDKKIRHYIYMIMK